MTENFEPGDYSFFAIDYYSRPDGRTVYLHFERCYDLESNKNLINKVNAYGLQTFNAPAKEYEEDDFFGLYGYLIPECIFAAVKRRQVPYLTFKQEYHFSCMQP